MNMKLVAKLKGNVLDRWLIEEGYSRFRFAKETGISPTRITHLLASKILPSPANRTAILRVTGMGFHDMFEVVSG